jgi:hypothetical protein
MPAPKAEYSWSDEARVHCRVCKRFLWRIQRPSLQGLYTVQCPYRCRTEANGKVSMALTGKEEDRR